MSHTCMIFSFIHLSLVYLIISIFLIIHTSNTVLKPTSPSVQRMLNAGTLSIPHSTFPPYLNFISSLHIFHIFHFIISSFIHFIIYSFRHFFIPHFIISLISFLHSTHMPYKNRNTLHATTNLLATIRTDLNPTSISRNDGCKLIRLDLLSE